MRFHFPWNTWVRCPSLVTLFGSGWVFLVNPAEGKCPSLAITPYALSSFSPSSPLQLFRSSLGRPPDRHLPAIVHFLFSLPRFHGSCGFYLTHAACFPNVPDRIARCCALCKIGSTSPFGLLSFLNPTGWLRSSRFSRRLLIMPFLVLLLYCRNFC